MLVVVVVVDVVVVDVVVVDVDGRERAASLFSSMLVQKVSYCVRRVGQSFSGAWVVFGRWVYARFFRPVPYSWDGEAARLRPDALDRPPLVLCVFPPASRPSLSLASCIACSMNLFCVTLETCTICSSSFCAAL